MTIQPVEQLLDTRRLAQAYINGEWVALSQDKPFDVINPATEAPAAKRWEQEAAQAKQQRQKKALASCADTS